MTIVHASRALLARALARTPGEERVLSESELALLLTIYHYPGLTLTDSTRLLARDKTSLSRGIARLTSNGLVRTEVNSLDGRSKDLFLTESGRESIELAVSRMEEYVEQVSLRSSPEHMAACIRVLQLLVDGEQS
jgi:DNA-binding MarR family transcriptional regulator